ncbi:phosphatidylethanolamine-binding protein [Flagelloscypha sp. PMI_526]|nr:phosphatidylethanolamine-binding protein [Flagelloscypha sp. PMI_526]
MSASSSITSTANDSLVQMLTKAAVIPAILPEFIPKFALEISFPDGTLVTPGMSIVRSHTLLEPTWSVECDPQESLNNKSFAIFIIDPDTPDPHDPSIAQVIHFAQTDFVVQDSLLKSAAKPLVPYLPPNPPTGSAPHRYVVAVYEQTTGLNSIKAPSDFPTTFSNMTKRFFFNLEDFTNDVEGNLELVSATLWLTAPPS